MNAQEAYDRIFNHFSQPGAEFGYEGRTCRYRKNKFAADPVRCAFGVLIPDENYREEFENGEWNITDIIDACPNLFIAEGDRYQFLKFVIAAQGLHDNCALTPGRTVKEFLGQLNILSTEHHGLNIRPLL